MNGYGYRCGCARCRSRGLMGPVMLITIGILFLLNEFGNLRFHYTWPVILIVIGAVKMWQSTTSTEGHGLMPPPANMAPPTNPGSGQVNNG